MTNDWIGRTLSKVQIQELLGHGGMAEVYLGLHSTLNRPVAVKILHAHLAGDAHLRSRTRTEAQSVAALRHPNIVQVYDFDLVQNRPYIVMELIQGIPLSDYLDGLHASGISLPLEEISRLIRSISDALDYAHARGIVHRDIKPANVMLRQAAWPVIAGAPLPPDAEPVLTDFGVARIATATTQTATGMILGTPNYISPEQVRGEPVDARSDIYSLGIMLYEMVAGKLPFDPEIVTPASILFKHVEEAPPPLPNASPELRAVTERALAKDPDDRYQRAGDLAQALQIAIETPSSLTTIRKTPPLPAAATPQPVTPAASPSIGKRRNLKAVGAIALGIVVLISGMVLTSGLLKTSPTVMQQEVTTSPIQQEPANTVPVAALVTTATPSQGEMSTPLASTSGPRGYASFRDANLIVAISDVDPPPEGFDYMAWLVRTREEEISLGKPELIDSELVLRYEDPSGENLLGRYNELVISLEPVAVTRPETFSNEVFAAEVAPETMKRSQLLSDVYGNEPHSSSLLNGLLTQAAHFDSHVNNAVNSIQSDSLEGGKSHSEHVINIIEGREGEMYGDWNENDRVENPGDDVGLLPYLLLAQENVLGFQNLNTAEDLNTMIEGTLVDIDEILLLVEDARKTALQIVLADSLELVQDLDLAAQLTELLLKERISRLTETLQAYDLAFSADVYAVSP
ncbi:MAG: protein kinase [Anaerolineales bacterium]|nr:protein kinase [Anaerolineales bacterium]